MIKGDVIFCATAITDGDIVKGIQQDDDFFETSTLALHRSQKTNIIIKNKYKK